MISKISPKIIRITDRYYRVNKEAQEQQVLAQPPFFPCSADSRMAVSPCCSVYSNILSRILSSHSHRVITLLAIYSKILGTDSPDLAEARKSLGPRSIGDGAGEFSGETGLANMLGVTVSEDEDIEVVGRRRYVRAGEPKGDEGADTNSS